MASPPDDRHSSPNMQFIHVSLSHSPTHVLSPRVSARKEIEPASAFVVSACSMACHVFGYYTLNYHQSTDRTSILSGSQPPDGNAAFAIEHPFGTDVLVASFFHTVH